LEERLSEERRKEIDDGFKDFVKKELLAKSVKPIIPKRIYNEELSRALYLNYLNPEKYNLRFFSEYFDIDPRDMIDIFDSVSYPIISSKEKKVFRIYRFNYVDM
jgi:uncharacterized protein YehS (DUF1456 family)